VNHYQQLLRREKDPLVGTRNAGRPTKEPGKCSEEGCDNTHWSKGLCQNHYRKAQRIARGLKKPGPKPDPTSPRSRHSAARIAEGTIRKYLVLGEQCPEGHELTEETTYRYIRKESGKERVLCKQCVLGYANGTKRYAQYGITKEVYEAKLLEQDYACAVCEVGFEDTKVFSPHIDHDHSCCPGKRACGECFRGLLCSNCNSALGYVKDDPAVLRRLLEYLEG
jgi:hypothetical protein